MELGVQEWQDALFLRYGLKPPDLPKLRDRCNVTFYICHTLDFQNEGLFTVRRNDLRDRVADLSRKSFTPTYVSNNPLIYAGCSVKRPKSQPEGSKPFK